MWGLFTIYSNYEPGLLFVDRPKWKNRTPIRGRREYIRISDVQNIYYKLELGLLIGMTTKVSN